MSNQMALLSGNCGGESFSAVIRESGISSLRADGIEILQMNITRQCNLSCRHCYAATSAPSESELSFDEGRNLIDDLSKFGCPVILFSGGEPLTRPDLPDLQDKP